MRFIWGFVSLQLFVFILLSPTLEAAINKKPVVFVQKVASRELSESLTYPARVEPRTKAAVVAEADGVVTRIIAPLGSSVRTRSPLLVIKNTDPIYQYSPMVVTSTVDGVVSRVEVTEGSRVSRGDKLLLVTDPEQVRVAVEVTAQDLPSIKPGMTAELRSSSDDGEPVILKVKGISPFVDPATGTASCELELEKKKGTAQKLPPVGVIARVHFKANVRKGISIADSAITYRGKDPFVRVVTDGKAKLVPVRIGNKQSGVVEIVKGLKDGDSVVERASGFIADGEEVEVQSQQAAAGQDGQKG